MGEAGAFDLMVRQRDAARALALEWQARAQRAEALVADAVPFVAKAYREGGVPTFPNAGEWLERAALTPTEEPEP